MRSLYEQDVLAWSQQQAEALRAMAGSDAGGDADWERIASGIERVGQWVEDYVGRGLRTILSQALAGYCDPDSLRRNDRIARMDFGRSDAQDEITPTIRRRIDLDRLWQEAFALAVSELEDDLSARKSLGMVIDPEASSIKLPAGIPRTCPFTLDALLSESFTYDKAVEELYIRLTHWRPGAAKEGRQ